MIDSVTNFLSEAWLGTTIAVLGIIVSLVIYRASQIGARFVYQRRSIRLIGFDHANFPQDVEVLYRGTRVARLTKSRVIYWNSGKQIVLGLIIVADDPVRCELSSDDLVLEVLVVKHTRDANKFTATIANGRRNCVILSFDYLDPGDGAVVEILHTASDRHPAIKGTIRGVPKGMLDRASPFDWDDKTWTLGRLLVATRRSTILIAMVGLGVLAIIAGFIAPDELLEVIFHPSTAPTHFRSRATLITVGTVYLLPGVILYWMFRRRFPKSLQDT